MQRVKIIRTLPGKDGEQYIGKYGNILKHAQGEGFWRVLIDGHFNRDGEVFHEDEFVFVHHLVGRKKHCWKTYHVDDINLQCKKCGIQQKPDRTGKTGHYYRNDSSQEWVKRKTTPLCGEKL